MYQAYQGRELDPNPKIPDFPLSHLNGAQLDVQSGPAKPRNNEAFAFSGVRWMSGRHDSVLESRASQRF